MVAKPALLTKMLDLPCFDTAWSTAFFQPASVVTSRSICSAYSGQIIGRLADIAGDDCRALPGETCHDRLADPARTAGDQSNLVRASWSALP